MTPMDYILGFFEDAFVAVFGWFFQILTASGAVGVYIAVFAMYCIVRFLLFPIFGNAIREHREKVGDD